MASSWETGECHFTWNLEKNPKVYKTADKILRHIKNNLAETDFLKIEHLLFRSCLQLWFKESVTDARESLNEAKREIENRKSEDVYKGYKSVELLNSMWIEKEVSNSERVRELHEELKNIELKEKDLHVVGAIRAAALMRLGPLMLDTNVKLFKAAHQACPSNQDFLFGLAHITGQKMRFMRPLASRYDTTDQFGKDLMDEEKIYWENLIGMKLNDKRFHFAKSMLGLSLSRRDKTEDKETAIRLLEEAYDDAPDIHEVCRNLIRFLKKTDLDRSVSILKESISKQPDRAKNHYQLALCYVDYAKKEKKPKKKPNDANELRNREALEELNECLRLDSSHTYALLAKGKVLQHLPPSTSDQNETPQNFYENMILKFKEFPLDDKLQLFSDFASFLQKNETAPRYSSRIEIWQEVMNMSTDESFEHQNESGKWKTKKKQFFSKSEAYNALTNHYDSQKDHLQLGILFYQNFEFDEALGTLAKADQTNAEVPYYRAKTYLKKGQEKIFGNQAKPEEAVEDFERALEDVISSRKLGLKTTKARKILADTALTIAHNKLQVKIMHGDSLDHPKAIVIPLEDRCVTSYRQAVRCGSLVAGLELLKLVQRDFIEITSRSKFIQMLAEIEVCCSQPQSDILHAESKPLTFNEGLGSKETDVEPCMLRNHTKIRADIKGILSKDRFFHKAWKELFSMEVLLLQERFQGTDGLQLDGREEVLLEDVNEDVIDKAVDSCSKTRPLLDRIMETFKKNELAMNDVQENYFPMVLKDENLTQNAIPEKLQEKLKTLNLKIDIKTHYPKLYEYLLKLQPKISAENYFLKNLFTLVNKTKHSNEEVLAIEKNPVELARQSTDKVEEICNFFYETMGEVNCMSTTVEKLESAIRQAGYLEGVEADELFKILSKNEDFVVRLDNTWKFLGMLALIRNCREAAGTHVDLAEVTELSERNSEFSKELRKCYLEVEAEILTNGGNQRSMEVLTNGGHQRSMEVLVKCHTTCIEADKLLNTALQSKGSQSTNHFPFPKMHPGDNKASWKGNVKKQLKKELPREISVDRNLLCIILEAQPCSNEDNYHFLAMREFLDICSRGNIKHTVSVKKEPHSDVSYDVLELTRWCVNHAEKLASKVMAHV